MDNSRQASGIIGISIYYRWFFLFKTHCQAPARSSRLFWPPTGDTKNNCWKIRNVQTLPRFATWSATTLTSSWWTGPTCRRRWTSWRRRWTCQQEGFRSHPPLSRTHSTSIRPDTRCVSTIIWEFNPFIIDLFCTFPLVKVLFSFFFVVAFIDIQTLGLKQRWYKNRLLVTSVVLPFVRVKTGSSSPSVRLFVCISRRWNLTFCFFCSDTSRGEPCIASYHRY